MRTFAFYISDHGYGHIMRNLPVIDEHLSLLFTRIVHISGSKHCEIAKSNLPKDCPADIANRLVCIHMATDPGTTVIPGSLSLDISALHTAHGGGKAVAFQISRETGVVFGFAMSLCGILLLCYSSYLAMATL